MLSAHVLPSSSCCFLLLPLPLLPLPLLPLLLPLPLLPLPLLPLPVLPPLLPSSLLAVLSSAGRVTLTMLRLLMPSVSSSDRRATRPASCSPGWNTLTMLTASQRYTRTGKHAHDRRRHQTVSQLAGSVGNADSGAMTGQSHVLVHPSCKLNPSSNVLHPTLPPNPLCLSSVLTWQVAVRPLPRNVSDVVARRASCTTVDPNRFVLVIQRQRHYVQRVFYTGCAPACSAATTRVR